MHPCPMLPDERSPLVIRVRVQEQKSLIYDELLLLRAAGHHTQRLRRAKGSGGGVLDVGIVASQRRRGVLCGRTGGMVAAPACERCRWPPMAVSGSWWAAPVLWVVMQPLWATLVSIGRSL